MAQHYAMASRFHAPSREAYIGMSLFYAEDAEIRAFLDQYAPHLVSHLAQAMHAHGNL